jgi:hypothetical protein
VADREVLTASKVPHFICSVVNAALYEAAEIIAAEGVSDVLVFRVWLLAHLQLLPREVNLRTPMQTRAASWNDWSTSVVGE